MPRDNFESCKFSTTPPYYYSLFKPEDRVVLQSAWKGDVFNGTVRWVGLIRKAKLMQPQQTYATQALWFDAI